MNVINMTIVQAVVLRHLFEWRRNLDRVVDAFWWPIVDVVVWGLTSNYLRQNNPSIPDVVSLFLGGIILWVFVQNSQRDINMPLLVEGWNRNLINLFTTPIRLREFIAGTLFLGLFKLLCTTIVLWFLAFFLYRFNIFHFGIYLIPAIVNLILIGWWVGFFIDGFILRFGYRVEPFAWALIFTIYPFFAVLYPVSALPSWAQTIAHVLPGSYIFENMRSIIFTGTFDTTAMIISFLLNIFYLILSLLFLFYMFQKARELGRLVKLN